MRIKSAYEEFLTHCRIDKKLSKNSLRAYQIDFQKFHSYLGGGQVNILVCDKHKVREYLAYLQEDCNLKASSVKRLMASVQSMFNWLEEEEKIEVNPFWRLKLRIRIPLRLPKTLSSEEVMHLLLTPLKQLGYQKQPDYRMLDLKSIGIKHYNCFTTLLALEIMFCTGIRVGELVSIKDKDINLREGIITIIGKGNRQRRVFLPDDDVKFLLDRYLKIKKVLSPETEFLLINSRGRVATTQFIRKLVSKAGKDAGLSKHVTPHMLRHSAATHLLEAGMDIRYVQKILGHHCISVTQIYTHVTDESLRALITKINPRKEVMRKSSDN